MIDKTTLPEPTNPGSKLLLDKLDKLMAALPTENELTRVRFAQISMAVANGPALADCDANSVVNSFYGCARLGLIPDPAFGHIHILPRKIKGHKHAQIIVGYRGYIELANRSGQYAGISAEAVYYNDVFDVDQGTERRIKHKPWWLDKNNKEAGGLRAAYATAHHKSGYVQWRCMSRDEVLKHRKASGSGDSKYSPWVLWEPQMWAKTAVVNLAKLLYLSAEFNLAVWWDEQAERGVAQTVDPIGGDAEPRIPSDKDPLMKKLDGDPGEGDGAPPSGDPPKDEDWGPDEESMSQQEKDDAVKREADEAHDEDPF